MGLVLVVTGIPGAGKSTVARLLARSLSRSAVISGDDLRDLVLSDRRDPNEPWDEEMRRQYELAFQNEAALARNFLRQGFDVVIDDVIHKGDLHNLWRAHFADIDHRVVLLLPTLEAALQRNADRPHKTVPVRTLRDLDARYREADNSGWIVIDNSHQSPEETVRAIRGQAGLATSESLR